MSRITRTTWPIVALLLCGCAGSPDLNIPAPWDDTEGPRAEAPIPNLEPVPPGWSRLGLSVRGKQIVVATIGNGPYHVYVVGGIAGDEPEGPSAADALRGGLFRSVPENMTVRIVRDMNPDGSALHTRANVRGIDLTRNWATRDHVADKRGGFHAASELETTTIAKDLIEFKPSLVLVFRSSARGPIAAMDGPGPLLAPAFSEAAGHVDPRWRAIPDRRYTERGSLESYVATELKKPVLTIEFQRGRDASTNALAAQAGIIAAALRASGATTGSSLSSSPVASAVPTRER